MRNLNLAFLTFFLCSYIFTGQAMADLDLSGSNGVIVLIEQHNATINQSQQRKQSLVKVLKQKNLAKTKRSRGESLLETIDKGILKVKKNRTKCRKLLRRAVKEEATRPNDFTVKTKELYIQLERRYNLAESRTGSLLPRIDIFIQENQPKPPATFRGSWNTNLGNIVLTQNAENVVTGTYFWSGGGTLTGKVRGNVLSGSYRGDTVRGSFSIKMNDAQNAWRGSYRSTDGVTGKWNATRQ